MAVVKNVIFDLQARTGSAEKSLSRVEERLVGIETELQKTQKETAEYVELLRKQEAANDRLGKNTDLLNTRMNNLNGTFGRMKSGITQLAAVAGIGLAFDQTIGTIINFDQSLADLSAITGATGGDLEFYAEQARNLGKTTTVSASEAVEAFKLIGSAKPELLSNKEALVGLTEQAIILSEASGIELPIAAEQLGLALNAMSLDASEASRVIDVLAVGAQKGTREIPYITDALSKFGGVAKQSGTEIETSVAAIEILGKAIPDASIAGTNMRGILIKLQTAAAANGREFKGLVAELELLKPRLKDVTFLKQTFGEENLLAAQTLISEVDALRELEGQLNETGAAQKQAATRTNTLSGDISRLKNAWDEAILSFANSNAIRGIVAFLTRSLPTILKLVILTAKAWVAYKVGIIATTLATKIWNGISSITTSGFGRMAVAIKISEAAIKGFRMALSALVGGALLAGVYELISAFTGLGDAADDAQKKVDQAQAREDARKKQNEIAVQGVKDRLDAIDEANKLELSKMEDGSKEKLALEKKINDEKLKIVNQEIKNRENAISIANDKELNALEIKEEDRKALGLKANEDLNTINKTNLKNTQKVNEEIAKGQQEQIDELKKLSTDLQVVSNQADGEMLRSKKELADQTKASAKAQKDADKQVKEGTLAALQKRVSDLRDRLTNDLRLDSQEFSSVVEEYIIAQKELEEATKKLGDVSEIAGANTLAGMEKQLSELRSRLQKAPIGDAEEFFGVNQMIIALEKKIKEVRKLLEEQDKRALLESNLAKEDEQERHLSVMEDLIQQGKIDEATAVRDNEKEITRLVREEQIEQLQIRIDYAQRKLQLMYESGEATEEELIRQEHEITEAQQELSNLRNKFDQEDKEKKLKHTQEILDGVKQMYSELFNFANQLLQNQIDLLDRQSEAQRKRIDDARNIASQGNAELLQLEEERLEELNKKRAKYVKTQQALAALELVANSAIAISKAAAEGGALAPFTIAATLIALVTGLAQARSIAQQASFEKGGYTGAGNPKSESLALGRKPYTYHKGEFVMDAKTTSIGRNRQIFDKILRGRVDMEKMLSKSDNIFVNAKGELQSKEIVNAIKNIPGTEFNLNKEGIFTIVRKKQNYKSKVDNIR